MTQPPKPLLDRLPAIPPRPSSKTNIPQQATQGKEEAARKRLTAKLDAMSTDELAPPAVDPRTAAVSALMVANFVGEEETRKRFMPLVGAKLFDSSALEDLPVAARFVLRILPKLGADLDARGIAAPEALLADARAMKESLARLAERHLADLDDAHGRLVTIRLGDSAADTVYDLRMLADLCRDHAETLAAEAGTAYRGESESEARALAQKLEDALLGPQSTEDAEWRAYLLRALAMLVPIYEEVCRAGRFLFHHEKPEARFPTLASVARVRRRLKRESLRRVESSPHLPAARSSRPASKSIPPEVSLVEVSFEEEQALAGVLASATPPPFAAPVVPSPIVSISPENLVSAPPDAMPPAPPPSAPKPPPAPMARAAAVPANLDLIEAVTLDFGAPSAAEDADLNLDTADLDLEVTYVSESNFYADLAGNDLGLFVATYVVKPPGTPLAVRLTVPQLDEPILVSGTVRWVREFSPSIEAPPGMGVALRPVAVNARRAIDAFMKVRAPILHDE
jgi:hypothetical protein